MKVLLAHPGTQYSHQLAIQLYRHNRLFRFVTGIAYGKDHIIYKVCSLLPAPVFRKISNRFIDEVPDRFIRRNILNDLRAIWKLKRKGEEENILHRRNELFQKNIPEKDIESADAIIGFDTSSWILIDRARQKNKPFYLDISIGHPAYKDQVYTDIIKRFPEWAFALKKKKQSLIELELDEMRKADQLVVASSFSKHTYLENGIPENKIRVNAYGVDADSFMPQLNKKDNQEIKFVFVGLVDARKGIPVLLDTWQKVTHTNKSLTLIGPVSDKVKAFIRKNYPDVHVSGRVSFQQMKTVLPNYDVLIFPSYFEGFGLVIPEAMACGLPVITTTATCGQDIIENGKEGIVIKPGDDDALYQAICDFTSERIADMGAAARKKAACYSWEAYGKRWCDILDNKISVEAGHKIKSL